MGLMVADLEQEHSDSMAERQQLGVGMATLHVVVAPVVGVQSLRVVQRSCLLPELVRRGSGRQLRSSWWRSHTRRALGRALWRRWRC